MTIVRATYRLQLNKDLPFIRATDLVPYLSKLGISHVYLSPILAAQPGSTHGYDTVDHTRLNPELGTTADYHRLVEALRGYEMGVIVDFVPNHMGVGGAHNRLWLDVLRNGENSRFANWFDIDWHSPRPDLHGKVLVPFLGTSYAQALAGGDLALKADEDGLAVWAYGKEKLPLRVEDERDLLAQYGSYDAAVVAVKDHALDTLVARQHWRLTHFMTGNDDLNYRRFFINSELAGIRIDRSDVFAHAHGLIFELVRDGLIDGLRLDHIDGLLDPTAYLKRLNAQLPREIPVWVEKILAPHEQLRADWPVAGTTGYEFGSQLTRLLTPAQAEPKLTSIYQAFTGETTGHAEETFAGKLRVMDTELAAELSALSRSFATLAQSVLDTRDLTQHSLERALRQLVANLSVYRTYVDHGGAEERDRRELSLAHEKALRDQIGVDPAVFGFIANVLIGQLSDRYDTQLSAEAVGKFQQFTGPVMAKGLEDTALYRFNRLVSLNEVGAHPDIFSVGVEAFHDANRRRLKDHPDCLLATSTHDTKRGEDTRAIIAAIADHPDLWAQAVDTWANLLPTENIHPNDLYLLFQQMLGAWPIAADAEGLDDRLKEATRKALREGRQRSAWGLENSDYETAVCMLIDHAFDSEPFLDEFYSLRASFLETGRRKALIQQAIKLTVPGVPDIYRGAEDWEQSLVDPDNRRLVDFENLARKLSGPQEHNNLKLLLTRDLLALRKDMPELLSLGSYTPLAMGDDIIAFERTLGSSSIILAADLSPGHRKQVNVGVYLERGWYAALPSLEGSWLHVLAKD